MVDVQTLVLETIPGIIGLVLVAYTLAMVLSLRKEVLVVVKGWALLMFVLGLAVLWILELGRDLVGGEFESSHPATDIAFVVFTIWLSVFVVSMSTVYRAHGTMGGFWAWLKSRPLNIITGWGLMGALLVGWASYVHPLPSDLADQVWLLIAVTAYLLVSAAMDMAMLLSRRLSGSMPALTDEALGGMLLLVVAWVGIPFVEFLLDVVVETAMDVETYNPYTWLMVVFLLVLVRSVTTTRFTALIVDPGVELGKRGGFRSYDIQRGVYLIEDDKHHPALELFSELVTLPLRPDIDIPSKDDSPAATLHYLIPRGLVVTRDYPEHVRKQGGLTVTPIIWLTESPGERRIAPTSLAVLTDTIIRFMESNPNSIVLLEGVEYLVTFNDFKKVLKSLDSLNETTWVTKSRLLISIDPRAFDPKELALLERDRKRVIGSAGIDELRKESRIHVGS